MSFCVCVCVCVCVCASVFFWPQGSQTVVAWKCFEIWLPKLLCLLCVVSNLFVFVSFCCFACLFICQFFLFCLLPHPPSQPPYHPQGGLIGLVSISLCVSRF